MRISPHFSVGQTIHVAVGYVHTPDISYTPVDHHNLPMVSPVDSVGKMREVDAEERMGLHSRPLHVGKETLLGREAPDVVIYHLHLYPRLRLAYQYVGDFRAYLVVKEYVVCLLYTSPSPRDS